MSVIKPNIFSVVKRFPRREQAIKGLFRTSESFRILCGDYQQCVEALQHWNLSLDEAAPARVREYEALRRELEEEILQNINELA